MEKKFAIIAVAVMCVVFAFIIVQNAGGIGFLSDPAPVNPLTAGNAANEEEADDDENDDEDENDEINNDTANEERSNVMGDLPIVTITMEDGGVIKLELYPEIAPNTVNNFIYLANDGFYNGLIFHRVISGFMIQGGCPDGTGGGHPGYSIFGEFSANNFANDLSHTRGVISMARAQPFDSAGAQFFIVHQDSTFLDTLYAPFGKVIEGMDVVDQIAATQTGPGDRPVNQQTIREITVETFGVEFPAPEKISR